MRNRTARSSLAALAILVSASVPALARPGGWGGPGWGGSGWDGPGWERGPLPASVSRDRSREGRVEVARFVGNDPAALGHGAIAVASQTEGQDYVPQASRAAYEAAVIDRLVRAGYDTTQANLGKASPGQYAELKVMRSVVEPAEAKRSPVSGSAAMSVGTRGSAYGLAVNVDMTKPLSALVSTRLEARIRDKATNAVFWEGRAEIATREGDAKWSDQMIAGKLAEALFDGFPTANDGPSPRT